MSDRRSRRFHKLNIWAGRFIPCIVLAALIYTLYCITYEIAVKYLLRPDRNDAPVRRGAAIAIIVVQYFFTFFILITWGRFFQTVYFNPGYIPKGPRPKAAPTTKVEGGAKEERRSRSKSRRRPKSRDQSPFPKFLDREAVREGLLECPPGLEKFYNKDVFVTGMDGVPRFCNVCWNWKPDRTHHSSELNRCVRRYDHYCPWVGGAVSETNYKFFVQTAAYSLLYCIFVLVVCIWIIFIAKADCRKIPFCNESPDGHWIGGIIIAGTFGLMSFGITLRFISYALMNITTVEDLQRIDPRHCLAIRIHESEIPRRTETIGSDTPPPLNWVRYPFTRNYGIAQNGGAIQTDNGNANTEFSYYAILHPEKGSNPWNLGSLQNWKSVMGNSVWDWFVPIRHSPCTNHDDPISDSELGEEFMSMEQTILPHRYDENGKRKSQSTRRRSRRRDSSGARGGSMSKTVESDKG